MRKVMLMSSFSVILIMCMLCFSYPIYAAETLVWPVPGHHTLSCGYHGNNAIDISDGSIAGANIVAAASGTVTKKTTCTVQHYGSDGDCNGFGTGLVIRDASGKWFQYAHMQPNSIPSDINVGSYVTAGQHIGNVGTTGNSTGYHLHFGISTSSGYWLYGPDPNPASGNYNYTDSGSSQTNLFTGISATEVTTNSALLTATKTLGAVTGCGYRIGTSADSLGGGENENPSGNINKMWYTASNLNPNTMYYYKFYYILSGTTYWSDLGSFKTVTNDTEKPAISNVTVTTNSTGYTVTCNVSDNVGIDRVQFPSWPDYKTSTGCTWYQGKQNGSTYTFNLQISDFNNYAGIYDTHIYAYDTSGNSIAYPVNGIRTETAPVKTGYYKGHTYDIYNTSEVWNDAKNLENGDVHLVSITSQDEQSYLAGLINSCTEKKSAYWIGLNDAETEGTYKWTSGETFSYSNWDSNQPDNASGGENYVGMWTSGSWKWNDYNGETFDGMGYILETEPKGIVATPEFSVNAGEYSDSFKLELSCGTDGAEIYYTTDGTEPNEASTKYTGAIDITSNTEVKAKAFRSDMTDSETADAQYTFVPATVVDGIDYSAVYDYTYYTTKYPDVTATCGTDKKAVLAYFVSTGMDLGQQAISTFNVQGYKARYGDLQAAFGNDLKAYYIHYITSGQKENRDGSEVPITFYGGVDYSAVYDYDYYIAKYADVKAAFGDDRVSVFRHFLDSGMKEGRQAINTFNPSAYKNRYIDLSAAFGDDWTSYFLHYINTGKNEGRDASDLPVTTYAGIDYSSVYDYNYYIEHNVDVKAAFGDDQISVFRHFLDSGMNEGRQAISTFNANAYKARYADLSALYGDNMKEYYMHYIEFGKKEGRNGSV